MPQASADIDIRRYQPSDAAAWNAFVSSSANGTFLFNRGYMDYHAHRFEDHSLLFHRGGKLVALLAAHREAEQLISHGGLSYGGVIVAEPLGAASMLSLIQTLQTQLTELGVASLIYKAIPHIYHRKPCEADLYALFRCGAQLSRRDVLSAIGPTPAHWSAAGRRQVTGAKRAAVDFELLTCARLDQSADGAAADWARFWALLGSELQTRHASAPVHSLSEILALAAAFPENIRLEVARRGDEILAGMVLFETATALHVQYMAASPVARRCAALDLLAERAIERAQAQGKWFDFGHSNQDQGRVLNDGLAFYKESHGASAVMQDHYLLPRRCPGTSLTD
ncbi:GNAT family N-acetyltransferase [Ideonella sp.]|uniref:GNAT family N-acetyltransferase n=1 Tax=Ideonella sp. TaxID=1929293 RepID=UPI003BB491DB